MHGYFSPCVIIAFSRMQTDFAFLNSPRNDDGSRNVKL